jgi:plasmid stabilization system protein ParE
MSRRVELRPAAERDLDRLADFVAAMDARAGDKRERDLLKALQRLGKHPFIGRTGHKPGFREFVIRLGRSRYLIRYKVTGDTVLITRIWRGSRARPPTAMPRRV